MTNNINSTLIAPDILSDDSLESKSLWFKYKSAVWPLESQDSKDERSVGVHNILRIVRSIRSEEGLAYASSPVTTGKVMYNLQRKYEVYRGPLFNRVILEPAMTLNYANAVEFVQSLEKIVTKPIIFPADMTPAWQEWEQAHFQALWLSIISEKCSEVYMSKDWEYSNGASEEFTHAMQLKLGRPKSDKLIFYNTKEDFDKSLDRMKNIKVYDYSGKPLSIDDGIIALEKSIGEIKGWKFNAPKLENCLNLLYWTKNKLDEGFYQK